MKNMNGNLRPTAGRPTAAMARANSELLPSARIRCDSSRIRVGERSFQSASDALSAYLQQFDRKQPDLKRKPKTGSSRNTSIDALVKQSAKDGTSPTSRRKGDAANVTGLLTGRSRSADLKRTVLNSSLSKHSSSAHSYQGSAQQSFKHSVSFSLPDSADESPSCQSAESLNTSRQHPTGKGSGSRQHGSSSSCHITRDSLSSVYGLNSTTTTQAHLADVDSGSWPNGTGGCGSPREKEQHAKSEVEVLLTEFPSYTDRNSGGAQSASSAVRGLLKEPADRVTETSSISNSAVRGLLKDPADHATESSSNSSNKSALQQEVEEALSRSAQLLENIKTDVLVSPRCVSDVGSLSTDILLSINPTDAVQAVGGRQSRSRHRYSYHTPGHHARSLSVEPMLGHGPQQRLFRDTGRRRSVDSVRRPASSVLGGSVVQDENSVSVLWDCEQAVSRSQAGGEVGDSTGQTGPPSWIQDLMPLSHSDTVSGTGWQDSVFSDRAASGGRKAPSWVNGLEQSDVVSSVDACDWHGNAESLALAARKTAGMETGKQASLAANKVNDSLVSELSYSGPGLNYSDLVSSPVAAKHKGLPSNHLHHKPPVRLARNNSFSGVGSSYGHRKETDRSKPPVTMNQIYQDLAGVDTTRPKTQTLPANLSSSVGADSAASVLRRKVCEDSDHAKSSLDKYLSDLSRQEGEEGRVVGDGRDLRLADIPRCSSINLLNGAGDQASMQSDVTGASPITKDSNFSSRLCVDDPTLTPLRHSKGLQGGEGREGDGQGDWQGAPDVDHHLLDGDRPWERCLPSFKAPVQVGNSSTTKTRPETPTLSGGQQPGSMEALKQMLFRLQNEETSTTTTTTLLSTAPQENGERSDLIPALKDYDFEEEPGGHSLERALVHLGRLKTLVQTGTMPPQAATAAMCQDQTTSPHRQVETT